MDIHTLRLQNFRNYQEETFSFAPSVNLICGDNGQGKTNLLEAVTACSTMRLFRTRQKKEAIRFGTENACILTSLQTHGRDMTIELRLHSNRAMEIYQNGIRQQRQSDAQGLLKTVLFRPEDLSLLREGALIRRRFLNTALCQMRPGYARCLEEYNRLRDHKTRILRDSQEKPSLLPLWDDFSLRMAYFGAFLIRYRAYYTRKLLAEAGRIYTDIAPQETFSGCYQTVSTVTDPFAAAQTIQKQLTEHVFAHKAAEFASGSCLSGPHKDDLVFSINEKNAAAFASQGQIRTAALSLKLAERELFRQEDGEDPVLLLDDVLSELDRKRQDFVLNHIAGGQVFITCCEDGISGKLHAGEIFSIKNGKIIT